MTVYINFYQNRKCQNMKQGISFKSCLNQVYDDSVHPHTNTACSVLGEKCVRNFAPMNIKCRRPQYRACKNQKKSTIFLIAMINEFCNRLFRNAVARGLMNAHQLHILVPPYTPGDLWLQSSSLTSDEGRRVPGGTHQPGACCLPCRLPVPACSQMRPWVCLFKYIYMYISPPDQVHISEKNVCS